MQRFFRRTYPRTTLACSCRLSIHLYFLLGIILTATIPVKVDAQPPQKIDCPDQSQIISDAIADIDGASQKIIAHCGLQRLKKLLTADNATARYFAAYALGRMGSEASDVVHDLIQRLNDEKDDNVRAIAAQTLGQIGPTAQTAVPKLIELLKKPGENFQASAIRANAAYALGQILQKTQNASLSSIAVPALTEALKDKNENIRANAAYALGQIGSASQSTASKLIDVLRRDTEKVQANAAYALGRIRPVEQEAVLLLIDMLKNKNDNLSSAAAYALGEIQPDAPQILQALTEAIKNKDTNVRINVARLLGQIGLTKQDTRPTIIQPLIHALENDSSNSVRIVAVQALVRINYRDRSLARAYINVLKQKDINISAEAAYGLGKIYQGGKKASANDQTKTAEVEEVTNILSSFFCNKGDEESNEDIRIVAVDALGKIYEGAQEQVKALLCPLEEKDKTGFLKEKSIIVRAVAVAALRRVGWSDDKVVSTLSFMLDSDQEDILVRLTSFEVLKDLAKDSNEARCKLKQLARKIKEIENEKSVLS